MTDVYVAYVMNLVHVAYINKHNQVEKIFVLIFNIQGMSTGLIGQTAPAWIIWILRTTISDCFTLYRNQSSTQVLEHCELRGFQ